MVDLNKPVADGLAFYDRNRAGTRGKWIIFGLGVALGLASRLVF